VDVDVTDQLLMTQYSFVTYCKKCCIKSVIWRFWESVWLYQKRRNEQYFLWIWYTSDI